MIARLVFGAALLSIGGCGSRPSATPTVDLQSGARLPPPDNTDGRGEILLWVTGDEEKPKTYRIAADGALRVLGEEPGIVIATSKGEMVWRAEEKEVNLEGCEHYDGSPQVPSKGSITVASLVARSGPGRQEVVESSAANGGEIDDLQHSVSLVSSIGPYLFVSESSYMYACGAHGNTTASAFVWDAEQGKPVDFFGDLPKKDELAGKARTLLDEQDEQPGVAGEESEKPELTQLVPIYGERGAMRIDAQFTRSACYACSDGAWSSYTRSAVVPTEWVPERMREWVTPPVVVKEFLEAHRGLRLGGWSRR